MRTVPPLALLALLSGLSLGACKQEYTSHDNQYCSPIDEDPHYTCAKGKDLVCITTSNVATSGPAGEGFTDQPQFLCRMACSDVISCFDPGWVCCPGRIVGATYGKAAACVPSSDCPALLPPPKMDVRPRASADARPATDLSSDRSGDVSSDQTATEPIDAPPVDAPTPDQATAFDTSADL